MRMQLIKLLVKQKLIFLPIFGKMVLGNLMITQQEEISYKRRSILLALASLEKADKQLKQCFIIDKLVEEFNKDEIKRILKNSVDRKILIENGRFILF